MKKQLENKRLVMTKTGKVEKHIVYEETGLGMYYIFRNREYYQVVPYTKNSKADWVII